MNRIGEKWPQRYDYAEWELELLTIGDPPLFRETVLAHKLHPHT